MTWYYLSMKHACMMHREDKGADVTDVSSTALAKISKLDLSGCQVGEYFMLCLHQCNAMPACLLLNSTSLLHLLNCVSQQFMCTGGWFDNQGSVPGIPLPAQDPAASCRAVSGRMQPDRCQCELLYL